MQKMVLSRSVGHWIISGNTEIGLPARSTNEAPCKYCLWCFCEAKIRRVKPKTLKDLIKVVTNFVGSLDEAEVRRDMRPRLSCTSKWGSAVSSPS